MLPRENEIFLLRGEEMIRRLFFVFLVAALAGCSGPDNKKSEPQVSPAPSAATPAAQDDAKWAVTDGINAPESVYVDADDGFIFVSDINGAPDQRDGNGYISKLSMDGKVIAAQWATGFNAPKGLRSYKGTLWTADLDEVVGIDIASGKVGPRVKIEGAKFLNDVACGSDGTVYVSDTVGSAIYAVKDGKASVFVQGDDIEYPNGLLVEGDKLIVAGWGKPEADFTTKVPGRLFTLDLKTKKKTLITPEPFGNTDGIESDGQGGYVVSDYMAGKIIHVGADGKSTIMKQLKQGTADIAYVPGQKLVIVPLMNDNKIAAYTF
jgi:sugar lactone lactonase YvrE